MNNEQKELKKYIAVPYMEIIHLDPDWIKECELILTPWGIENVGKCFLVPENRYNEIIISQPKLIL